MRFYSAHVNIAGDRNAVVVKTGLTAAEVMVLQAIHGHGEVHTISEETSATKAKDNTAHAVIREKLDRRYGRVRTGPSSDRRPVLVAVFPGWPNVKLPPDIDAAGVDPALLAEDQKPKRSTRSASTKAD